jgi:hypothetical protein
MKQKELGNLFSVSLSSIKKWHAEGFPREGLKEQIGWVRLNRAISSDTLVEARKRKIAVETKLKELELMIKEGHLIQRAEVLQLFLDRISVVKSGLLSLHRSLVFKLDGQDPHAWSGIIKSEVYNLLNKFSRRSGPLKGKK